jgi:transcriptional regulator with XRE-family HTH domain
MAGRKGKTAGKLPDTGVKKYEYTPEVFVPYVKELVARSKQSMRQVALQAGLDHSALYRYLSQGQRPNQDACIALAHYFGLHPNEILQKAGYPARACFDLSLADPDEFSPEAKAVARELMKIEDGQQRRQVAVGIRKLVSIMVAAQPAGGEDGR